MQGSDGGEAEGEARGGEGSNVLGFARFRLGRADPTPPAAVMASRRATPTW